MKSCDNYMHSHLLYQFCKYIIMSSMLLSGQLFQTYNVKDFNSYCAHYFQSLNEEAGGTGEKSAVTSQALEFRAKVEKRLDQLKKTQNQIAEEVPCDSLAAVKNMLSKHEVRMLWQYKLILLGNNCVLI